MFPIVEAPAPTPAGLNSLPRITFYQVVHELTRSLPLPHVDTPEAITQRNEAAIAHVACLLPANPEEAHIAVQYACRRA
jgi:hypothetical protein